MSLLQVAWKVCQTHLYAAKGRSGYRMGHGQVLDHMMLDGLEDAYEHKAMGVYAQGTADEYGLDREAMDEFAINSLTKAQAAIKDGGRDGEITPVTYSTRKGEVTVDTDEQPVKRWIKFSFAQLPKKTALLRLTPVHSDAAAYFNA